MVAGEHQQLHWWDWATGCEERIPDIGRGKTTCRHALRTPALKATSLFAYLTGLRISDIQNLQRKDFDLAPDQGYCLRIRTQKTQTEATLPISNETYELCGRPWTGKVFKGLKRSMINYPLKNWLQKAGITKPITFHYGNHNSVSIHAPTWGATLFDRIKTLSFAVSIHAPTWGATEMRTEENITTRFQSTLLREERHDQERQWLHD